MKYTGKVRCSLGKNGMEHYHLDFGNVDGVLCNEDTRTTLKKGNFEFGLSFDKEGYRCWNNLGVQLQIKSWDLKTNKTIIQEKRNESIYNSVEMDLNLSLEDFDKLISGLQELKKIIEDKKQNE